MHVATINDSTATSTLCDIESSSHSVLCYLIKMMKSLLQAKRMKTCPWFRAERLYVAVQFDETLLSGCVCQDYPQVVRLTLDTGSGLHVTVPLIPGVSHVVDAVRLHPDCRAPLTLYTTHPFPDSLCLVLIAELFVL